MNIGILDHMGYGNLGDAATQDVVIAGIKKRLPDSQLIGFSLIPEDTEKRHGIPCYPIWWQHPRTGHARQLGLQNADKPSLKSRLKSTLKKTPLIYIWAKPLADFARETRFCFRSYCILRSLDVLIISGGGQIDELWHGPWLQPYTLFKFSVLTKLARRKLYFLNVGAGPLKHPLSQFFARWAVRLADYRSFRDQDSQERVRKLGVKGATHVYPDAVYALRFEERLNGHRRGFSQPLVGINPTGFCDSRIWPQKSDAVYHEYIQKLVEFSVWLIERGYSIRLFSTDIGNDRLAIEDINAGLVSRLSPFQLAQVSKSTNDTVNDVLGEMAGFHFILTSKYHGIIFSHVLTKPVISLSYHTKMNVAMHVVGQGRFCADIGTFTLDWLTNAFSRLAAESDMIKSGSAAAVKSNATMLSKQFDALFKSGRP